MEATNRRFFKFMMPGFHQKLNLPPAFCEKLKDENSKRAIINSCRGTWKISICKDRDGLICFENGWPIFVHQHGLNIGDVVLFEHTGELHFNAFFFDPSACEKEFFVEVKKEHEEEPEPVNADYHSRNKEREPVKKGSGISYHSYNEHFIVTMTPYHAYKTGKVTVPAEFSRSNNFWEIGSVTLRDPRRKAWPVKLLFQRSGQLRCRMERGWHDFYVSNKLKEGDVCVFDLNRHSKQPTTVLMDVQIFRAPL
ncbi:hypothetical protein BUALT_Bualt02G0158100 [Buddleja alternifolia]|uniref:TF-B3 domain-containing protein n=1 Tax=Buddleja alternifolia TaxID=168488 RepID=A0AAV6Y2N2_9LAMI|nr:hypothetical protein BUALT_Bualt02G0158100 [Buddleja alternifolia]